MSNKYKHGDRVPSDVLCARLRKLARHVTDGPDAVRREFVMRIPAEHDYYADLVLSAAAKRIEDLELALSTKEQKEKDAGKPAAPLGLTIEIEQQIVDSYHEILPECPRVSAKGWAQSQTRKNLHKRWRADKRCRSVEFWEGFFDVVRHKSFWMTGNAGKPIEQMRLAWLLGPKPYDDVLTLATEIAEDSA